jgi:hypothetical protein
MEDRLHQTGRSPDQVPMEELESLWQRAKAQEKQAQEKHVEDKRA